MSNQDILVQKVSTYIPPNEYDVAMKNLKAGYNLRAYIKKIIKIYDKIAEKLPEDESGKFYLLREERRDYSGEHWNRKFIRAVQAVLNSTKGKIGKALNFLKKPLDVIWMNFINFMDARNFYYIIGENMIKN